MAVTISIYPSWKDKIGEAVNLASDSLKVALLTNSATYNSAHDEWADISANEIANGNGYTTGGLALSSVTWTSDGTNNKLDAADAQWTASGGAITAYKAAIYDDTVAGDPLIAFIDLDGVQTANDGAVFKLVWNAAGIFTLS